MMIQRSKYLLIGIKYFPNILLIDLPKYLRGYSNGAFIYKVSYYDTKFMTTLREENILKPKAIKEYYFI